MKQPSHVTVIYKVSVQIGPDDWAARMRRVTIELTQEQRAALARDGSEYVCAIILEDGKQP